jgi:hypothetical protein
MSDTEDEISLYFYITNVLASKEKPFELFCDGESIFKTKDTIKTNDLVIIKTTIENKEIRKEEEEENDEQFVTIRLFILRIGVMLYN